MKHRIHFAALALALCAAPVWAQASQEEAALSARFDTCVDESDGSNEQLVACAEEEFTFWDKRLNAAYKKARQACADDACRKKLQDAQRLWIQYKEAMNAVVLRGIGSEEDMVGPLNAVSFRTEETKKQTKILERLYHSKTD